MDPPEYTEAQPPRTQSATADMSFGELKELILENAKMLRARLKPLKFDPPLVLIIGNVHPIMPSAGSNSKAASAAAAASQAAGGGGGRGNKKYYAALVSRPAHPDKALDVFISGAEEPCETVRAALDWLLDRTGSLLTGRLRVDGRWADFTDP